MYFIQKKHKQKSIIIRHDIPARGKYIRVNVDVHGCQRSSVKSRKHSTQRHRLKN